MSGALNDVLSAHPILSFFSISRTRHHRRRARIRGPACGQALEWAPAHAAAEESPRTISPQTNTTAGQRSPACPGAQLRLQAQQRPIPRPLERCRYRLWAGVDLGGAEQAGQRTCRSEDTFRGERRQQRDFPTEGQHRKKEGDESRRNNRPPTTTGGRPATLLLASPFCTGVVGELLLRLLILLQGWGAGSLWGWADDEFPPPSSYAALPRKPRLIVEGGSNPESRFHPLAPQQRTRQHSSTPGRPRRPPRRLRSSRIVVVVPAPPFTTGSSEFIRRNDYSTS